MKQDFKKEIEEYRQYIVSEIGHWKAINEYGCNDPFWADGVNMNLTRNHIIYAKRELAKLCQENKLPLPDEYFLQTPPEVKENYMAVVDDSKRVSRIRETHGALTVTDNNYNDEQTSLL